jgi:hypothetical protein
VWCKQSPTDDTIDSHTSACGWRAGLAVLQPKHMAHEHKRLLAIGCSQDTMRTARRHVSTSGSHSLL